MAQNFEHRFEFFCCCQDATFDLIHISIEYAITFFLFAAIFSNEQDHELSPFIHKRSLREFVEHICMPDVDVFRCSRDKSLLTL